MKCKNLHVLSKLLRIGYCWSYLPGDITPECRKVLNNSRSYFEVSSWHGRSNPCSGDGVFLFIGVVPNTVLENKTWSDEACASLSVSPQYEGHLEWWRQFAPPSRATVTKWKGGTQTAETTLPSRQRGRKGRFLGGEPGLSGGEGMETRQGRGIWVH